MAILLHRAADLTTRMLASFDFHMSADNMLEDAKSFHFDLALATAPEVLDLLLIVFPHDRILFGSDTPYVAEGAVLAFNEYLNSYPLREDLRKKFAFENAAELFLRLNAL